MLGDQLLVAPYTTPRSTPMRLWPCAQPGAQQMFRSCDDWRSSLQRFRQISITGTMDEALALAAVTQQRR